MVDFLTKTERSERMRRIRSISQLEIDVRDFLEEQGYELELDSPDIVGRPDIVILDKNAVVFVNGCFWHRHENCKLAARVSSEKSAQPNRWKNGIPRQIQRDQYVVSELLNAGWRVLVVWECAVSRQKAPKAIRTEALRQIVSWLESDEVSGDVRRPPPPG
jgi:DNA mismatch endonuclease (patch repair protein)